MIFNMSGGGAAGLNFKIIGGPTQHTKPENATDNTIWIDTELDITEYYLSSETPQSPINGAVWVTPSDDCVATFSAIKKSDIAVYPAFAAQYIDDSWVTVPAEYYQQDSWLPFQTEVIVYEPGYFNTKLLGNKLGRSLSESGGLEFRHCCGLSHDKLVDISRFRNIDITAYWSSRGVKLSIRDPYGTDTKTMDVGGGAYNNTTTSMDISELTGPHSIHLYTDDNYHASNYIKLTRIALKL